MVQELFAHARRRSGVGDLRVRLGRRRRSAHGDRAHGRDAEGAREMRSVATKAMCAGRAAAGAGASRRRAGAGSARRRPRQDPRVGLKAGFRDAGVAARNMELVANVPKPEGFFDPDGPPARRPRPRPPEPEADGRESRRKAGREPEPAKPPIEPRAAGLNFANSDLAFSAQRSVPRQLQRLQHLRHRSAKKARLRRVGRVSGRPGRHVGLRQPAVHVGGADARRLDCGTQGVEARSAPSVSAACASSTSATSGSRSRSPPCRPAAARTRTRS